MFDFFNNEIKITAPVSGKTVALDSVSDPVFSDRMIGDGIAIIPDDNLYVAPCSGELAMIFPTGHAYAIRTQDGVEILVHIGLDTVNAGGHGFKVYKKQGDKVKKGDPIVKLDMEYMIQNGFDLITPVIITSTHTFKKYEINVDSEVKGGITPVITIKL